MKKNYQLAASSSFSVGLSSSAFGFLLGIHLTPIHVSYLSFDNSRKRHSLLGNHEVWIVKVSGNKRRRFAAK